MSFQRTVKAFLKSHKGHNIKALAITLAGIDHLLDHKDWTGLAYLISGTEAKMSSTIRQIVGECLGGIAVSKSTDNDSGLQFKLGDNWGPTEKLEVLRDLVAQQESMFGEKVQQGLLGKVKKEAAQKSLEDCREHIAKYLEKHGYTMAELIASPMTQQQLDDATLEAGLENAA